MGYLSGPAYTYESFYKPRLRKENGRWYCIGRAGIGEGLSKWDAYKDWRDSFGDFKHYIY